MIVLFSVTAITLHKEYYSITEIKHSKKEQTLQISMRLFTNDIDLALNKHFSRTIELGTENETANADNLLVSYLNQKFTIWLNNKQITYEYLGKEFEKDVSYIYLECPIDEPISTLTVQNSVLTELYFEQENIVKIHINDLDKSLILNKENDKGLLNF